MQHCEKLGGVMVVMTESGGAYTDENIGQEEDKRK